MNLLVKAITFVALLGVLIFVHELGHFLVAKLMNVKVVRFSIGFGRALLSFRRGETEYRIAAIPLGGYVKMAGDDPNAEIAPEDQGRGFLEQAPWKRLVIAVAGPAMNMLLPFLIIIAVIASGLGEEVIGSTIGTVIPGAPAQRAGLEPGDRIRAVTGPDGETRRIRDFQDLQEAIAPNGDQTVTLELERAGKVLPPVTLHVQRDVRSNGLESVERGVIGVVPYYTPASAGPVAPGAAGPLEPFDLVVSAGGKPIANAVELERALAAAKCGPLDLEVVRELPRPLPGVVLADHARKALTGVPTCRDGKPSIRIVDPWVSATIAGVEPGGPADQAGLRRGDVVTAVNKQPVHTFNELSELVNRELAGGKSGTFTLADGRTVAMAAQEEVTKNPLTGYDDHNWRVGLSPPAPAPVNPRTLDATPARFERSPGEIVAMAYRKTVEQIRFLVVATSKLFTGGINPNQTTSLLGVAVAVGEAVDQGLNAVLALLVAISVNLGIMNLLPIPVLDGGHIAQALVEMVTRRPLSIRMREVANVIGLVLLISLMLFAFKNDIVRQLEKGRPAPTGQTQR
jgi:regulator of sigma E protease